jgi:5S rRNA maturation endonuclease (ribonuclease M5)
MGKLAPTSIKYIIKATIKANGVIEKPDVIGAVFGQTEGLLGANMDLRELQRTGRIGRIDVTIKSTGGKSEGEVTIPSSLDAAQTALIAATIETIERVGPCTAEIEMQEVQDVRTEKRDYVVGRAQDILKRMGKSGGPEISEVSDKIKAAVRTGEISNYKGSPCGPEAEESEEIIIVEGRADIINLLRYGIKNTVAVEGTSISDSVVELSKEKKVTMFVDGDRGGQLIVRELMQKMDVDFVAQAPDGKEVEELAQKEILKALRDKVTATQFMEKVARRPTRGRAPRREFRERRFDRRGPRRDSRGPPRRDSRGPPRRDSRGPPREDRPIRLKPSEKALFKKTLGDLVGSRAACIFNEKGELLGKVPAGEVSSTVKVMEKPYAVVFDGKVTSDLARDARMSGVKILVGMEKAPIRSSVAVLERKDL